jgi:tripartite-type tricarboxylate transporter receptor subunit TctC
VDFNRKLLVLLASVLVPSIVVIGCGMGTKESMVEAKYPTKPITIIVPFPAGGSTDLIARMLEKRALQQFGQPLVVINKPGGATTIGMNELAGANPDGYTIGVVPLSLMFQPLYGPTRYHYPTALEPLVKVAASPSTLATLSQHPWNNLNELIAYAKKHPGELKYGHAGLGTTSHVVGEIFAREAGIDIVQVPFKGESEALAALLGGHVHFIITTPPSLKEYVYNGTVSILGVAIEKRLSIPGFENAPTLKEQGVNVAFNVWNGIAAPKLLPATEKARLAAGLKEIITDPSFKKDMENIGMIVDYMGPEEFNDQWIADNATFLKIIKETGIAELIANQKN